MESNHPFRQSMLDLNEKIISTVKRVRVESEERLMNRLMRR